MRNGIGVVVIVFGCGIAFDASGGEVVYKCQRADGKFEYRDTPCPTTTTGKKIDVPINRFDSPSNTRLDDEVKAFNKKMNDQAQAREKANVDASVQSDREYAYCQTFRDQIQRQQPYLQSNFDVERNAAMNEIGIARRRLRDANCAP
jgi:hypothetical protein